LSRLGWKSGAGLGHIGPPWPVDRYDVEDDEDVTEEAKMKFRSEVEPPQPMHGLEVPAEVIEALGEGERPPVVIRVNGHSWRSRIAKMRGRYLIGFSKANRAAAGVDTGEEVEVEVELDTEPRVIEEPEELKAALDADPAARAAWDALAPSHRRRHVHSIESAKKAETRAKRIEKTLAELSD
jgi:hypothetical protein